MITFEETANGLFAKQGDRIIGLVVERSTDGKIVWQITAVRMKWVAKGEGEAKDFESAKRALNRAWRSWLDAHGLVEKPTRAKSKPHG